MAIRGRPLKQESAQIGSIQIKNLRINGGVLPEIETQEREFTVAFNYEVAGPESDERPHAFYVLLENQNSKVAILLNRDFGKLEGSSGVQMFRWPAGEYGDFQQASVYVVRAVWEDSFRSSVQARIAASGNPEWRKRALAPTT